MPFLENVTRGRNVPRERLEEVAHHYELFGGVSPINAPEPRADRGARARARARTASTCRSTSGNRNWHPFLDRHAAARCATTACASRARVLHLGVQLVLGLPPVPRGHRPRAGGGRRRRARGAASCASSTTTRASSRRTPTASATRSRRSPRSGARPRSSSSPRTASRPRWPSTAATPSSSPRRPPRRGGGRRRRALGRLPEPQRPAAGAVARAGRLRRRSATLRGRRRRATSSSRRSASSPTTSRCSTTSTTRRVELGDELGRDGLARRHRGHASRRSSR